MWRILPPINFQLSPICRALEAYLAVHIHALSLKENDTLQLKYNVNSENILKKWTKLDDLHEFNEDIQNQALTLKYLQKTW